MLVELRRLGRKQKVWNGSPFHCVCSCCFNHVVVFLLIFFLAPIPLLHSFRGVWRKYFFLQQNFPFGFCRTMFLFHFEVWPEVLKLGFALILLMIVSSGVDVFCLFTTTLRAKPWSCKCSFSWSLSGPRTVKKVAFFFDVECSPLSLMLSRRLI